MIWTTSITIPPNTPSTSPVEQSFTIKGDYLVGVSVLIPAGHHAVAGLRIYYGNRQIIPANEDGWLRGDDESLYWSENMKLPEPETTLRILGYNDSTNYDHTFYIRFITEWSDFVPPYREEKTLYRMLINILSGIRRRL